MDLPHRFSKPIARWLPVVAVPNSPTRVSRGLSLRMLAPAKSTALWQADGGGEEPMMHARPPGGRRPPPAHAQGGHSYARPPAPRPSIHHPRPNKRGLTTSLPRRHGAGGGRRRPCTACRFPSINPSPPPKQTRSHHQPAPPPWRGRGAAADVHGGGGGRRWTCTACLSFFLVR
eukprot:SAG22_NODE_116_length_19306_cov_247.696517_3_plen_174_part_00